MSTAVTEIQGIILKEGWLLKRSKHLKQWRNRWVQISDQCILYSFKNRFDKKPSQIVDLRHFPIVRIISSSNNHKIINKKPKPFSPSSSFKHKQKENKLNKEKVLENKIIELSSCDSNNKTIYQFKTLMYLPWFNIFAKCQTIISDKPNTDCLIQLIPSHLMSTIIASHLYSFERFILCRISKWFYSLFNINEYNFIYHYYADCLYWIQNIQQYISTSYFSHSSIHSMHTYRQRTSSSTDHSKYASLDLTNGNLSHLLNDVIKMQQFKFFVLAYDQIVQLQNVSFLERKLSLKQKLLLKESYSLLFAQRKKLPSYIYKKQQQQFTVNKLNRSQLVTGTSSSYNGYCSDDMSYLMIPANINTLNLNGNKSDFHKYGAMKFLYSIILCSNLSRFAVNPLQNIKLDDNMLDINDIELFVESLLHRRTEMDNLQNLSLNANPRIYSIEAMELLFESIGRKCPNLQVLSLRRINAINDEIFKIIVSFYKKYMNKTKLTTISLVGCSNVSLEGIDWLNKNLFDLQNQGNYSLFANIDILINIPKTQIIKHNHQNRWDKRIVVC